MRYPLSASSTVLLVVGAALLLAAWVMGSQLGRSGLGQVAPEGSLMEVHLDDGSVYMGAIGESDDAWVLSDPVIVVPAATEDEETTYSVQPLTGDPYGIGGPILIPHDRVLFIGGVLAGSAIDAAYRAAFATNADEPTPSPGRSASD